MMAKLLHIECSPRKDRSTSIMVAREFLQAYQSARPGDEVETLDLWSIRMPELDGQTINAKYRILHGHEHTAAEADAWKAVVDLFEAFNQADKYLFSLPMWNFGVPYKLKHFIDVITQPGLAFHFSPDEGYRGLVTGKPAVVIYARGSEYKNDSKTTSLDFQKPYLEVLLRFIGFSDIRAVVVEPTLGAPDQVEAVKRDAAELATTIARNF
jgi:FMN-dependent NADH-azoreductase